MTSSRDKDINLDTNEPYLHMVHEISNSMAVISAISQQLFSVAKNDQSNSKKILELSEKMWKRINGTNEMIDSFKTAVRTNTVKLEKVVLEQAILEAGEIVAPLFERAKVKLYDESELAGISVYTSRPFLVCILVNLLKNACMAVQKNSDKAVEIKTLLNDESVLVSVIDSGQGVSPEFKEQVFKTSFSTTKEQGGLGLGLIIVDKLAATIGGRVFLKENSPFTEFVLEIPRGAC